MPLYLFTSLYLVAFAILAVTGGNAEFIFYIVVLLAIIGAVMYFDRHVHFSTPLLWGLSIWGLMHLAGGNLPVPPSLVAPDASPVLYNLRLAPWLPKYDQLTHAYGFGITTFACWQAMRAAGIQRLTLGIMVLLIAAGMGFGAINEVVEFTATLVVPDTNVGGYVNTGWDLVSNLTGATIATIIIALTYRRDT